MVHDKLGDLLDAIVGRFACKDAVCIGEQRVTYGELARQSDALAWSLLTAGARKGDRIALWMGNSIEWVLLFYAAAKIGAVLVPLSTRFKADEAHYILGQSEAPFLVLNDRFAGTDFVQLFDQAAPGFRTKGHSPRLPELKTVFCVSRSGTQHQGLREFADLQAQPMLVDDGALQRRCGEVAGHDPFLIQYTSGTTGFPKGAVLTQANFARTGYEVGLRQQLTPQDRFFSPAPYFHVSGTMHALTAPLAHGCTLYSVEKYELETVLQTICDSGCTAYHGFNFFKDYFARSEEFAARYDLHVLRRAWTAGTAADMARIGTLGIRACNLYGLSETTGCSSMTTAYEPDAIRSGTVGKPLPGIEISIQDRHGSGAILSPGDEGEICIRGWNVMRGYWGKPEETRAAFDEAGWFHTGDLGATDGNGYLRFLGRLKDIIRVGGENLSPLEVENLLRRHSKVAEACVVGVPDARLGEVCMAFVQLRSGQSAQEAEIMSFCRSQIAGYKVPRYVRFVDAFPMTGNNKIRRVEVKELARRSVDV